MEYRIEKDSLGEVNVPKDAYWGSQAQRTFDLFKISGLTEHPKMIEAFVMLKKAAAATNTELGLLDKKVGDAIVAAADEILSGKLRDQFIVDVFHMGAGTSLNMNVNEVLANRAEEILGGRKGEYKLVNPNDHPNFGQSTNDTVPASMRIMSRLMVEDLLTSIDRLSEAFGAKGQEFDKVLKSARTHLQDAVPIRLGQEFAAYAAAIRKCRHWFEYAAREFGGAWNRRKRGGNRAQYRTDLSLQACRKAPDMDQHRLSELGRYARGDAIQPCDVFPFLGSSHFLH